MTITHHKAETRGHADHGWVDTFFSFSFGGYYNPDRVQFGVLRVLNDDTIQGGKGFGSHPHDNMEIVSIPLKGSLRHEDNMGHAEVVGEGEIQVMSTGTGVFHSEYNNNPDSPVQLLQIWVYPNKLNVTPRYEQVRLDPAKARNALQQIISPAPSDSGTLPSGEGTWIYQDAWFYLGGFDKGRRLSYDEKKPGNGIYIFVIEGAFLYKGQRLEKRDGLGITGIDSIDLEAAEPDSRILVIDVPMKNNLQ